MLFIKSKQSPTIPFFSINAIGNKMKNILKLLTTVAIIFGMTGQVMAGSSETEESNKAIVQEFYNFALNDKNFDAASKYLGKKYIQHNPFVSDGREGLKGFIKYLNETFPDAKGEIKRVFADDDHVILHILYKYKPADLGEAVVDIFRLDDGKIVEHWDVFMDIHAKPLNDNGML